MRALKLPAVVLACVLAAGCASGGRALQRSIDVLMHDYAGDGPGASLLVVRDGVPAARRNHGYADLEARVPASSRSNYRLASISKQFTAAAVLLLAEDGALRLDDPARRWLPELPAGVDAVTLHHLLTHASGLVDYEDVMPDRVERPLRDADVLRLLAAQDRLYFQPGSSYRYSNSGYALLALVVERASGMRYARFLRERIFLPLGMRDTVAFEDGVSAVAYRAYGYSRGDDGAWVRTDQSSTSAVLGDGGIYSSIDDLAHWDAALYDDRLLSGASRALAFAPHVRVDDEPGVDAYGYGWRLHGDGLWHSGETIGFRNVILRWPRQRLTVILLSNRSAPEPRATALRIAALFRPAADGDR